MSRILNKILSLNIAMWLCVLFAAGSVVLAFWGPEKSGAFMGQLPCLIVTLVLAVGLAVSGVRAVYRKRYDSALIHIGCACTMAGWLIGQHAIRTTSIEHPVTGSMAMIDGDKMDVLWTGPNYQIPLQRLISLAAMRERLPPSATEWMARIDREMLDFVLEEESHVARLPFTVHLEKFTVERYDSDDPRYLGPVREYRSRITILEPGKEPRVEDVRVNHPVRIRGYHIYQMSWNDGVDIYSRPALYTVLQFIRDPGLPVVYAGFVLIVIGTLWLMARFFARSDRRTESPVRAESISSILQ